MSFESVLYGFIAGVAIVLMGVALRPRGRRITNDERVEVLGWVLVASFFIAILQIAGFGAAYAVATGVAAVVLLMYMAGKRLIRKSGP